MAEYPHCRSDECNAEGSEGGKAFELIRRLQPSMPVLLSSGYSLNGHADEIMGEGRKVLTKNRLISVSGRKK
jgi:hypothetical protein